METISKSILSFITLRPDSVIASSTKSLIKQVKSVLKEYFGAVVSLDYVKRSFTSSETGNVYLLAVFLVSLANCLAEFLTRGER